MPVLSSRLRVLIADFDPDRSAVLERRLAECTDIAVARATAGESLQAAVAAQSADVVIACMRSPDRLALDELCQAVTGHPLAIVLFVDADNPAFMEAAIAAGVSSYHVVGAALPEIKPIVRTAIALFQRHRRIEVDLAAAQALLAESAVIDKAKARLIRQRQLTEPEAYRLLRRRAMNEGRRIADIARDILAADE